MQTQWSDLRGDCTSDFGYSGCNWSNYNNSNYNYNSMYLYLQTQFGEDRCTQIPVIMVTDPQTTHKQTGMITVHCAAASTQCIKRPVISKKTKGTAYSLRQRDFVQLQGLRGFWVGSSTTGAAAAPAAFLPTPPIPHHVSVDHRCQSFLPLQPLLLLPPYPRLPLCCSS